MYKVLLFVHVVSATALLGPVYLMPLLARMRGGAEPSIVVLKLEVVIERWVAAFAVVSLLTGGWLIGVSPTTKDGGFGDATWLHIGMALFFVFAGLASGFAGPKMAKALTALQNGDKAGAVKLLTPVDKIVNPLCGVLGAVIIYLMVIKP